MVFSLSPVRLLHPSLWDILQLLLSLLAQMKLRQLRLPLLHAQVLRHAQSLVIHLSLGLVLRGISDSLPRTVLVHETLLAIALMTVASLKIAHISDSPLAIVQATDGDSLQEIPLLLCVGVRPVPPLMMNTLGNPHHGLLLPPFGRWWISFSRPFLSIRLLLPIHRRDHSIICYYGRG